jgi:hypothetical protein
MRRDRALAPIDELSFVACEFTVDQIRPISEALQLNTVLRRLDLTSTALGDDCAFEIATALMANTSITALNLSYCGIGCRGVESIVFMLSQNAESSLQELNLSHNKINPPLRVRLELLRDACRRCRGHIKSINLQFAQMGSFKHRSRNVRMRLIIHARFGRYGAMPETQRFKSSIFLQ